MLIPTWPCRQCGKPHTEHPLRYPRLLPDLEHIARVCRQKDFVAHIPKRAISLRAPWVYAILHLGKDIENRSLSFPKRPGWYWLHASLFGGGPATMAAETEAMVTMANRAEAGYHPVKTTTLNAMRGNICGIVQIIGHTTESTSPWFVGPLGLTLGERVALPTLVPAKGALGLWRVQPETLEQLRVVVKGDA